LKRLIEQNIAIKKCMNNQPPNTEATITKAAAVQDNPPAKKTTIRAFGEMLNYGWILNNMGFFLFLSAMAIVYIGNGHMADNRIRRINETGKKLKDLQYEYKTVKSEMMFKSRESEMIRAAVPLGLQLDSTPPVHIKMLTTPQQ